MRLRTFIILISAGAIGLIMTFFYFQTDALLGARFNEMKELHFHSVSQFATTIIEARKYTLRTFRERHGTDHGLAKAFLLSRSSGNRGEVKSRLETIRSSVPCDFADILDIVTGRALNWPDLDPKRALLHLAGKGESGFTLQMVRGEPALVSYSLLKLYEDAVGVVVMGYFLNRQIAGEISAATNTKSEFLLGDYSGNRHVSDIVVQVRKGKPDLSVKLVTASDFISSSKGDLRKDVLVVGAASLLLVTIALYLLFELGFVRGFQRLLSDIEAAAKGLDKGDILEVPARSHPLREISSMLNVCSKYTSSLRAFQKSVEEKSKSEAVAKMAAQVAHDLRSPLSALEVCLDTKNLGALPEERRTLIHATVDRIRGIAQILSDKTQVSRESASVEMIAPLVDGIMEEKRKQYESASTIEIRSEIPESAYGNFANFQPTELKRALSNLIDNAVQSIEGAGKVSVSLVDVDGKSRIVVIDTGKGIPSELLPKIFNRGVSHGKSGGTGLGLWHAKQTVMRWNGTLSLQSRPGVGTRIEILLPKALPPSWFVPKLPLSAEAEIVILDDDRFIHDMWDERLRSLGEKARGFKVIHFQRADEFQRWHTGRAPNPRRVYLCDYELIGQATTGLELIDSLKLHKQAILVTSHHEQRAVRGAVDRMGVKLLPKMLARMVQLEVGAA